MISVWKRLTNSILMKVIYAIHYLHVFLLFIYRSNRRVQPSFYIKLLPSLRLQSQGFTMGMNGFLLSCLTAAVLIQLSSAGLVRKVIRHRRENLMPRKTQENLTLPHPEQPVVFNHVYNINVPSTPLCSVDLDSPGGAGIKHKVPSMDMQSTEHMEHTVDGDNQIVFTHRINIPKQACGCNNQLPDIKDILNRLEMLESELSSLREQCSSGAGCCGAQVTGMSAAFYITRLFKSSF